MSDFTTRAVCQMHHRDHLRREYFRKGASPRFELLCAEAANRWAQSLGPTEFQRCLIHFAELNRAEQNAILADAARRIATTQQAAA